MTILTLSTRFEQRAREQPDRPALAWNADAWRSAGWHVGAAWPGDARTVTYGELDAASNRLARVLARRGAGPEVPVGLVLERSPPTIALILAILKAGAAYLPLDPRAPLDRLAFSLRDSGAPLAVTAGHEATTGALAERFDGGEGPSLLDLGALLDEAAEESADPLPRRSLPDALAYLIYTSGSTGRPKAVAVPHRSIVHHMEWMARALPLTPDDVFLQKTVLTFDASVSEVFAPLEAGALLVLAPPQSEREPHRLVRALARRRVTAFQVVPSLLRLLLDEPGIGELPALRRLMCGGEALDAPLLARAAEVLGVEVFNLYGPTETSVEVAAWRGAPGEVADPVPVGRAIPGVRLDLVAADGGPAAAGESGEIAVSGPSVSRGYHRRPALTAASFRPAPGGAPGDRRYFTGDLGRRLDDGQLVCLGRRDGQVKLHGLRLELGELESLLEEHPGVARAAAALHGTDPGDQRLVAYVVPAEGEAAPSADRLRGHLRSRVPEALLPSVFVTLEALPYTGSGKLDRRALPPPEPARAATAAGEPTTPQEKPRGPLETAVASRMSELLGGARVGRRDDLFTLGGNSLMAMRLLARLRRELGREATLAAFLEEPTAAGLARRLAAAPADGGPGDDTALPAVVPRDGDGPAPASPAQERVLFVMGMAPGMLAYQFQNALHFRGHLDVAALRASLDDICRRHEVYRTTFHVEAEGSVQRVHPVDGAHLEIVDLSSDLPSASWRSRLEEAERRIQDEVRRLLDPGELPLVRWVLYTLGEDETGDGRWVMLHHEHHLIHDGWSFNLFLDELLITYRAAAGGRSGPFLPPPDVQFTDFARLQQEWMDGPQAARQVDWWRRRLADPPPPLDLPYDRPRPVEPRFRGRTLTQELPAELSDRLRHLARQAGGTPFMALMTGFLTLLHRYSGQSSLAVGSAVANRRWPGSEGLYGMLVDNVILRGDLSGRPTFRQLLEQVRREALEVWERQEVAFDRVVREVAPARDASVNPLFQVMFSFHDAPVPELTLEDLTLEIDESVSNGSAKFDMNLVAIPRLEQRSGWRGGADSRRVTLIWEFDRDLFDQSTVERGFDHLRALLAAAVQDPDRPLDELPMMGQEERLQVTGDWCRGPVAAPPELPIHRRFLEQARRRPGAEAVVGADRTWTYGELARRVTTLAAELGRRGIAPEEPVGIALPRTPEMVASVLAVLAAGGAYLPLDPAFPAPRLLHMLEDSGTGRVIARPGLLPDEALAGLEVVPPDAGDPGTAGGDGDGDGDGTPPPGPTGGQALAYVLYTSGSTGRPKGVEIPHSAVDNFLASMARAPGLGPEDTLLAVTTLSFDISVLELLLPLTVGARVVLATADEAADGARLAELLERHGVSHMQATPATWRLLLDAGWGGRETLVALCGGEELPAGLAADLASRVAAVWNMYGPTETTVWSAARPVSADEAPVRIGGVVGNTRLQVVTPGGAPAAVGAPGEIHIGGDGVARGYRGRPALTAERFVPDPDGQPGDRRYATGDRARRRGDGTLRFLGRSDGQVKVRGFRIELGEVEQALRGLAGVDDAVVAVRGDATDRKLVAWYVARDRSDGPSAEVLRGGLAQRLPGYMIPSLLLEIDAVPLTPNGKVDRRSLPDPSSLAGDGAPPEPPSSELEKLLAEEWVHLGLGDGRDGGLGVHDNFFHVGGHSLLATRHVHRLNDLLGIDLTVGTLYRAPTIASLAAEAEERLAAQLAATTADGSRRPA